MIEILKHITTGIDGESYDLGRISWIITTLSIISIAVYMVAHGTALSIQDFGISLASNTAAHGGAIMMKKATEPQ